MEKFGGGDGEELVRGVGELEGVEGELDVHEGGENEVAGEVAIEGGVVVGEEGGGAEGGGGEEREGVGR